MKVHNYGNDYAQSMKFQKEVEKVNVSDNVESRVEEAGKENKETKEENPSGAQQKGETKKAGRPAKTKKDGADKEADK